MSEKILLIDGHSILNRAFYGLPDLKNSEGKHTGAVYGFLNILFLRKRIHSILQWLLICMLQPSGISFLKHTRVHGRECLRNCVSRCL